MNMRKNIATLVLGASLLVTPVIGNAASNNREVGLGKGVANVFYQVGRGVWGIITGHDISTGEQQWPLGLNYVGASAAADLIGKTAEYVGQGVIAGAQTPALEDQGFLDKGIEAIKIGPLPLGKIAKGTAQGLGLGYGIGGIQGGNVEEAAGLGASIVGGTHLIKYSFIEGK